MTATKDRSLTGHSLIRGAWCAGSGTPYAGRNPATGDELPTSFGEVSAEQLRDACAGAAEAAQQMHEVSAVRRADFLDAAADAVAGIGDPLVARATAESALPPGRIQMETGRTVGQLRMFAKVVREGSWVDARWDRPLPDRAPLPKPDLRRMLQPLGPVAVFGASNFPLAFSTAGGDTASALAAGCPVVVKAHPAHPGAGELVAAALHGAAVASGLPPATVSFLHGPSAAVGEALVRDPAIKAVGFTGSLRAGRALMNYAMARPDPIPVFAEMGSVNPVFVLPAALAARGAALAGQLAGSVALGVGQFCTNPGLVVMQDGGAARAFVKGVTATLGASRGTMLTWDMAAGYRSTVAARYGAGVELPTLEDSKDADGGSGAEVCGAVGMCSGKTFLANAELREEVFGPFTLVVLCKDAAEMTAVAASLDGQLTATILGDDGDRDAAAQLVPFLTERAGRLLWNGFPTGVEVCPAMHHGGPWPATSDSRATSVGTAAIQRFARPVCYQSWPAELLPEALRDDNPLQILRMVDGEWGRE